MKPRAALVLTHWWTTLTVVLAVGYLYIGVSSPLASVRWPTLAGALLVLAALSFAARGRWFAARRPIALGALAIGAVLPVVTAWWSLVVPLTGLLILVCGALAVRASEPAPTGQPADGLSVGGAPVSGIREDVG
jgi:hypothetical protein